MRLLLRLLLTADERARLDDDLATLREAHARTFGQRSADTWLRGQYRQAARYALTSRLAAVGHTLAGLPPLGVRQWLTAAHTLRRSLGSTVTIIITVGLAAGVLLAMFAAIRVIVVAPLPYRGAADLVWIYTDTPPNRFRFSVVDYRALEADHRAFQEIAAYQTQEATLGTGTPTRGMVRSVTTTFFPMLGLQPAMGRLFDVSDSQADTQVAVLSHEYWLAAHGGRRDIVGQPLHINGVPFTVAGVLERARGPLERNVAAYVVERWPEPRRKGPFFTTVIGRPRPDVDVSIVRESLRATNARLFPLWQSSYQDRGATWNVLPLKERLIGDVGPTLWWLLAALGLVLMIALSNAMHLLLARGMDRRHEWAVRRALGASPAQLYHPLVIESLLLSLLSGVVAVAVCSALITVAHQYGQAYLPRVDEVGMTADVWLLAVALMITCTAALLLGGLIPAARRTPSSMDTQLRHHRTSSEDRVARRSRGWLVSGQLALTTPLLVLTALTILSLRHLVSVPLGFTHSQLLTARISLAGDRYASEPQREALWTQLLERLRALPGVDAASVADGRPPDTADNFNNFDLEDRPTPPDQAQPVSVWVSTTPDYFTTMGIGVEQGVVPARWSLADNTIVVDRAWADRFLPGQNVIGKRLKSGGCTQCPWTTIVGIVSTVRWQGLDAPDEGAVYYPFVDFPNGYVMVRTSGTPVHMDATLRRAIADVDAGLAITRVTTGDALTDATLATPRYLAVAATAIGALSVSLAAAGLVAILTHFTRQHKREFGVRVALGGRPSDIGRLVLRYTLRVCSGGLVAGTLFGIAGARVIGASLSGTAPVALAVVGAVVAGLFTLVLVLAIAPIRQAARVNPSDLLRTG